jgi:hypothetical protein
MSRNLVVKRIIDAVLILVVIIIALSINREVLRLGMPSKREEEGKNVKQVALDLNAEDLGSRNWQVGSVKLNAEKGFYDVSVVGEGSLELFKVRIDAVSGQPLAIREGEGPPQRKEERPVVGSPITPQQAKARTLAILPKLSLGKVVEKEGGSVYEAYLRYEDATVAKLKLDPATKRPLAGPPPKKGKKREAEKLKIVPKKLVEPLGWIAALTTVVAILYYSWKRSLLKQARLMNHSAKVSVREGLRRTLALHCYVTFAGLAIAIAHVLDFASKTRLSLSYILLVMMVTVALSGTIGKYLAVTDLVRSHWRRFHVPYTALFFLVLAVHILQKTKLLS